MATLEECHRKEYGHNKSMIKLAYLDCDEQELLLWRSGLIVENVDLNTMSVCSYHREYYSKRNQVRCCDPFFGPQTHTYTHIYGHQHQSLYTACVARVG